MSTRRSSSRSPERSLPEPDDLRRLGLDAGLHAVGFTHTEPFRETRIALQTRKAHGRHGGMSFTYRNPVRSTEPRRIVRNAQSLIVGAWPYASPPPAFAAPEPAREAADPAVDRPRAEIAAYAWRDHYAELRSALAAMAEPLRAAGWKARVVADDNALVDRAAAVRAGIGWSGKNTNVLLPGHGSWYVLGAVVTDAPLAPDSPIDDGCGPCRRCIDGCPTGAIVADGVVDARRCLAWLLQAPGDFPVEFRAALGTRIYGCDECQVVCPPSRRPSADPVGDEVTSLDLLDMLQADDDELLAHVHRWYIPDRDLATVRRNALVALGNATIPPGLMGELVAVLDRYETPSADGVADRAAGADPMLAEHAAWARRQQGLA